MLTRYDKTLWAIVVPVLYWVLSWVHVAPQMTVEQTVAAVLTAAGVYTVSNKQ